MAYHVEREGSGWKVVDKPGRRIYRMKSKTRAERTAGYLRALDNRIRARRAKRNPTMKKSTKTALVVGGALVAVAAIGGVAYASYYKKPTPSVPAGQLKAGSITPVTTFVPGTKYTFIAMVPAGINDNVALEAALTTAGWTGVNVVYFMGTGTLPQGFEGNASSYAATGTWNGAANAPVPANVIAAATP